MNMPDIRTTRRVTRVVLAESAGLAAILALVGTGIVEHLGWTVVAATAALTALGPRRVVGFAVRRHTITDAIRPDPARVAVLELGDLTSHVITETIRLPDAPGDPPVHPIIVTGPAYRRVFLAIRAEAGTPLPSAIKRMTRRLDARSVPRRAIETDAAVIATLAAGPIRERWDHLTIGATVQATLRVSLGTAGMTEDLLVQLAAVPRVTTVLAWSDTDATLRVVAEEKARLDDAVRYVETIGVPVERLDGEHLPALWTTLPLGSTTSRSRPAIGPAGVLIGHDRYAREVRIRVRPGTPPRIVVTGDATAARLLTTRLERLGIAVPVNVSIVERPVAADAPVLTAADVVICHAMPVADAAVVADSLRLAETGSWLSRIGPDMVAVISDGAVRWALLAPETPHRIARLGPVVRT